MFSSGIVKAAAEIRKSVFPLKAIIKVLPRKEGGPKCRVAVTKPHTRPSTSLGWALQIIVTKKEKV